MIATAEKPRLGLDSAPASVQEGRQRLRLSRGEETELAARIANGDSDARNRMVEANLGLVVTIARAFQGRGLELDDLIGEGNVGLIRAADEFNPSFGARFSTYAAYWIKEKIRSALINKSPMIRLPAHMFQLLAKWRLAEKTFCREWGRVPTFEELASVMELSPAQQLMVARARHAERLKPVGRFDGETGDGSFQEPWDLHAASEDQVESEEERIIASHRMERLDARERASVALRYGLDGEVLTFREIGRRYGVTREWARKIEIRALRKLNSNRSEPSDRLRLGRRDEPQVAHTE
jgi:RNA polymerase primary sigma factor